jgi:hypothetical protein
MTLQSLGSFEGNGETLARMVAKGLCTIDDLDKPAPGSATGYFAKNILRDWIIVNENKWKTIQDEFNMTPEPAIEVGPSPRDFLTSNLPF